MCVLSVAQQTGDASGKPSVSSESLFGDHTRFGRLVGVGSGNYVILA